MLFVCSLPECFHDQFSKRISLRRHISLSVLCLPLMNHHSLSRMLHSMLVGTGAPAVVFTILMLPVTTYIHTLHTRNNLTPAHHQEKLNTNTPSRDSITNAKSMEVSHTARRVLAQVFVKSKTHHT